MRDEIGERGGKTEEMMPIKECNNSQVRISSYPLFL